MTDDFSYDIGEFFDLERFCTDLANSSRDVGGQNASAGSNQSQTLLVPRCHDPTGEPLDTSLLMTSHHSVSPMEHSIEPSRSFLQDPAQAQLVMGHIPSELQEQTSNPSPRIQITSGAVSCKLQNQNFTAETHCSLLPSTQGYDSSGQTSGTNVFDCNPQDNDSLGYVSLSSDFSMLVTGTGSNVPIGSYGDHATLLTQGFHNPIMDLPSDQNPMIDLCDMGTTQLSKLNQYNFTLPSTVLRPEAGFTPNVRTLGSPLDTSNSILANTLQKPCTTDGTHAPSLRILSNDKRCPDSGRPQTLLEPANTPKNPTTAISTVQQSVERSDQSLTLTKTRNLTGNVPPRTTAKQPLSEQARLSRRTGAPLNAIGVWDDMVCYDPDLSGIGSSRKRRRRRTDVQKKNKKDVEKSGGSCLFCFLKHSKCSGERPCQPCAELWNRTSQSKILKTELCVPKPRLGDIVLFPGSRYASATREDVRHAMRDSKWISLRQRFESSNLPLVLDVLEPERLRRLQTPGGIHSFIFYSQLQSTLYWKVGLSRMKPAVDGLLDECEDYWHAWSRSRLYDMEERSTFSDERHAFVFFLQVLEELVFLKDQVNVSLPALEAAVNIIMGVLTALSARISSNPWIHEVRSAMNHVIMLITALLCKNPRHGDFLPQQSVLKYQMARDMPLHKIQKYPPYWELDEEISNDRSQRTKCACNQAAAWVPQQMLIFLGHTPQSFQSYLHTAKSKSCSHLAFRNPVEIFLELSEHILTPSCDEKMLFGKGRTFAFQVAISISARVLTLLPNFIDLFSPELPHQRTDRSLFWILNLALHFLQFLQKLGKIPGAKGVLACEIESAEALDIRMTGVCIIDINQTIRNFLMNQNKSAS
ncbi:hypothetical protein B0J11DRAFT_572745 [Dendryphion nanum]|uniref:Uncharacterized protein n=1 Tax=Dendryphion nanum TaxID=256645 RepID=A0A9P9IB97_9PLEO|nr:hypothetical protein B0J11DRAFT_572745 [Dendryphion nanum]